MEPMPASIKAGELQLLKVFSDNYLFEIPEYQRPYAWTTEHVGELLDDVQYAVRTNEDIGRIAPYFLGSIVIIKNDGSPVAQIVDGQQRITTLTILFCALRELASDHEDRNTLDVYVRAAGDRFAGVEGQFRLNVRERDRRFFQDNVQETRSLRDFVELSAADLSDSQQRMLENARYLWENLSKLDEERRVRLTKFLVQRCYLVVVSASDQSSAYRIFTVMNDRGLDLSPTDILKADIIGDMDENVRARYTEIWEDTEEDIGRDNFRDLFAHIRMIYKKDKARGALNQEFRDDVLENLEGRNFIDDVLSPYASVYETVTRADYRSSDDAEMVNRYLRHLARLDNNDWVPPAMSFFNRHPDTPLLIRFTRDLERLAYGMFIRRANINERINRYAGVLRGIEQEGDLFEDTSPLQLQDWEKRRILEMLAGPVYLTTRVRRQLLLRLDGLLADAGASYDYSTISIEHVLPQNPSPDSEWVRWFPDGDTRERWTHSLANLVLLSFYKNSQAQNYEFARKKQAYFSKEGVAPFALTTQVLNEPEWSPSVLERRQRHLIDLLKQEWRLG